ncbi:MAG: DUF418 domain-containing protein [Planctomycetota bacterium]|jgi:uncharacterized protein
MNTGDNRSGEAEGHDALSQDPVDSAADSVQGAAPTASVHLALPVAEGERIEVIDILRGFALMGVLLMNMQAFAMPFSAYMNPTSFGNNDTLNFSLWCMNHVAADAKFITIFSMLFGAGIVLMTTRARERTGKSAAVHYRRMFLLLMFGAMHGTLIWHGDILLTYSICGMIVFWFCRLKPWLLISISGVLLLVSAMLLVGFGSYMAQAPEEEVNEMMAFWAPSAEQIQEQLTAYQGRYVQNLSARFDSWVSMFGFLMFFGWRILGIMMLGMAMLKIGLLTGARSKRTYATLAVLGFVVGLPLAGLGIRHQMTHGWDLIEGMGIGSLYNYFASLLVAFAWIGVIVLLARARRFTFLTDRLAAVGRMAFTNYIMHSVICTTIYYGFGLGFFGRVDRAGQLGIVLAIVVFQLWYSPLWLKRFRFGPLEWLWRSLTYGKRQPFKALSTNS